MQINERLTNLIHERGISMRELGRRIGVSHVSIGKWLNGVQRPTPENIEALSEFFSVTPAFLLFGDESLQSPKQSLILDENTVSIPVIDASGSCGSGSVPSSATLVKMLRVSRDWLAARALAAANLQTLHIITATGDSMEPGIKSGDFLIVDTSQKDLTADGLYALQYSNAIFIKRVQIIPDGSVRLLSDNSLYAPIVVEDSRPLNVIGKCILAFNVRDL